jgi:hypothetical protein
MASSVFRRVPSTRLCRPIRRSAVSGFESIVNGFWEAVTGTTYPQSMSATETAIASFPSKIYTWAKSLPGIAGSTATISRILTWIKSLSGISGSTGTMSRLLTFYRALTSASGSNAIFSIITTFYKSLISSVTSIADMIAQFIAGGITYYQTVEIIESSMATLNRELTFYRTIVVTEINIAVISTLSTFYRILSSISAGIASLEKGLLQSVALQAVATSITGLIKSTIRIVSMVVQTSGQAMDVIITTGGKILRRISDKIYEEL